MSSAAATAERIRTLREMLGLSQLDLSAMSGVSQSMLSQVEKLRRDPSPETIEKLAVATETPLSFFDVPASNIPDDSLHFRKNKTAPVKLTAQVKAYFREAHRVVSRILDKVGFPIAELPVADARTELVDLERIEQFAAEARAALRLDPDGPIPHVTRSLERAGIAVFRFALAGVEENRIIGKGHYGVSYWAGPGERPVIGYFAGSGDRDRFTIAHELGHIILHTYRKVESDQAEREAHQFAGALLLPYARAVDLISNETQLNDFARIKAAFGISIQAAIARGLTTGLITEQRRKILMIQVSQRGWRRNEPVEVGYEEPQLVGKALSTLWPNAPFTTAAEPLAIQPTVLNSIAPIGTKTLMAAKRALRDAKKRETKQADGVVEAENVVSLSSRR